MGTRGILRGLGLLVAVLLLVAGLSACARGSGPATQIADPDEVEPGREQASHVEGVHLNNPDYTEEMFFKAACMHELISFAFCDGRLLLNGGQGDFSYEALLAEGSLAIILANRYTGDDIVNTAVYSRGDILLEFDEENSVFRYYRYMGAYDAAYEPGAVEPGQRVAWSGGPEYYTTDGMTLFQEDYLEPGIIDAIDPGPIRERFNIPPTDEARAIVFTVYRAVNVVMGRGDVIQDNIPESLDDYIALVGRRNQVAWANPYTAGPMIEVPWTNVPVYYGSRPATSDPPPEIETPPEPESDDSVLAGNYSYALGPSPVIEWETRAYAQFYFYMPDGSLAAYQAIGRGYEEHLRGSEMWAGMAREGGWDG